MLLALEDACIKELAPTHVLPGRSSLSVSHVIVHIAGHVLDLVLG